MVFVSSIEFSDAQLAQKVDSTTTEPTAVAILAQQETEWPAAVVHYHGSQLVPRPGVTPWEESGSPAVDEECAAIFAHVDETMIPFHDCAFYPGTLFKASKKDARRLVGD
jgi:hypothetical protein